MTEIERAIETLRKISDIETTHNYHELHEIKEFNYDLLTALEALQEKQERRWIPVSERLPERFSTVLITAMGIKDTERMVYEGARGTNWMLCGVSNPQDYKILAWQPPA